MAPSPNFTVAEGDPGQISQAAAWHQELADALEFHHATVLGTSTALIDSWNGEAASAYHELSQQVSVNYLLSAGLARDASAALTAFGQTLARSQHDGAIALHEAEFWLAQQELWQRRLDAANTAITNAQTSLNAVAGLGPENVIAAIQRQRASTALTLAQGDQQTAQRELHHAQQQVLLWEGRGRRAWDDAVAAASRASGSLGSITVTPPPLAGLPVDTPLPTPPKPTPPPHHDGGVLGWLEGAGSWTMTQLGNSIRYSPGGQILQFAADSTHTSLGGCVGGTANVGIWSGTGSVCYIAAPDGTSGTTLTYGTGHTTPDIGITGSVGPVVSNGQTLQDQDGTFHYAGASGGDGLEAGGGSVAWGRNSKGQLILDGAVAWTPTASIVPASAQYGQTNTLVFPSH